MKPATPVTTARIRGRVVVGSGAFPPVPAFVTPPRSALSVIGWPRGPPERHDRREWRNPPPATTRRHFSCDTVPPGERRHLDGFGGREGPILSGSPHDDHLACR